MENSKIAWCHNTFNCWVGCSKTGSIGCLSCYAEELMDHRYGRVKWGKNGTRSVTGYSYWKEVLKWEKEAAASGNRKRVFCASLADVFEDWNGQVIDSKGNKLWWPDDDLGNGLYDVDQIPLFAHQTIQKDFYRPLTLDIIRRHLFKLIKQTPNLDWLLLTKRPENIAKMLPYSWLALNNGIGIPDNIWFGVSICTNEEIHTVWPIMENFATSDFMPGIIFVSMESLLDEPKDVKILVDGGGMSTMRAPDLIIVGGESGKNRRKFDLNWARLVRDTCSGTQTKFFMKQTGNDKIIPIPSDLLIRDLPK